MISEVSRAQVLEALEQFDRKLRPWWGDWERRERPTLLVIPHDGQLYPLRQVWSFVTGASGAEMGYLKGAGPKLAAQGFAVVALAAALAALEPSVWWVNQGSSYDAECAGGFVSVPSTGAARRIEALRVGDVIVHHADKAIRAIGRVTAVAAPVAGRRKATGLRAGVEYFALGDRAVASRQIPGLFEGLALDGTALPFDDGPFQANRALKKGYLWRFSAEGLARLRDAVGAPWPAWASNEPEAASESGEIELSAVSDPAAFDLASATRALIEDIAARGFVYEPWQIAAFVTALRTKPFVILAGVSGTGKSRLPRLVAGATGCVDSAIPVRPDWTDSSDVVGYVDLQGRFRPGPLLVAAERAQGDARLHLCVVDEMNLARVEHYFAEVLSRIEDAAPAPLVTLALSPDDAAWGAIALPANLAIVGTVNMDDSAHGFSRKVLDRAFTLELSDVDLRSWGAIGTGRGPAAWPLAAWSARPTNLAERAAGAERAAIAVIVDVLVEVNAILAQAQLQVGYRTRDEVVGFVRNAAAVAASFVTRDGAPVAPLDLALLMKILPRIAGGSGPVRQVVLGLLGFATTGTPCQHDQQAQELAEPWRTGGRRGALDHARYPRTAARLCLMWDRLVTEGFTSFWL